MLGANAVSYLLLKCPVAQLPVTYSIMSSNKTQPYYLTINRLRILLFDPLDLPKKVRTSCLKVDILRCLNYNLFESFSFYEVIIQNHSILWRNLVENKLCFHNY